MKYFSALLALCCWRKINMISGKTNTKVPFSTLSMFTRILSNIIYVFIFTFRNQNVVTIRTLVLVSRRICIRNIFRNNMHRKNHIVSEDFGYTKTLINLLRTILMKLLWKDKFSIRSWRIEEPLAQKRNTYSILNSQRVIGSYLKQLEIRYRVFMWYDP